MKRFVISTIFTNGGEATRALEFVKAIQAAQPREMETEYIFITHGSRFDALVTASGFRLYPILPTTRFSNFRDEFETRFGELIGKTSIARAYLQAELQMLETLRPDIVVHGFWPIASIARRMVSPSIPGIAFLPLPLTEAFLDEVDMFPDEIWLSRLPADVQRWIHRHLPCKWKLKSPALRHRHIAQAAADLGWHAGPLDHTFDMLRSDCYIITDNPIFYQVENYDDCVHFVGSLFSETVNVGTIDESVRAWLAYDAPHKLFCSLGSVADERHLHVLVEALQSEDMADIAALVLVPKGICSLSRIAVKNHTNRIFLTDTFIDAKYVNAFADMTICHGGQGTVQTAIASGTPIVGIGTQPEQQINLQHLERYGAAIRLTEQTWTHQHIRSAISRIYANPSYYYRMKEVRQTQTDARKDIGSVVWDWFTAI